jgi:hypothetical protein
VESGARSLLLDGVWAWVRHDEDSRTSRRKKAGPSTHDRFDEELSAVIKHLHTRLRGNPGIRRVHAGLAAMGYATSTNRVHRLMGVLGLTLSDRGAG